MTEYSPCFVIPNYNHGQGFEQLLIRILQYGIPVVVVNDGSNTPTTSLLTELSERYDEVACLHSSQNGGKGSAVMKGLRYASEAGYSHGIQVDADGQHNLDDIEKLLLLSQENPQAVISGRPVYDESVPLGRFLPRYITHFWVWVETLSFDIKDSMCGFRAYPLVPTMAVISKVRLGQRMDFDIEVLVRLYWDSVEIISFPTKVIYPEDGTSHFKLFQDNWLITKMHIRLVLGMLRRGPQLLFKRQPNGKARHWSIMSEKGSYAGLSFLLWVYRFFGRWVFLLILHPVILYYSTFAIVARRASRQYLSRVAFEKNRVSNAPDTVPSKVGWWTIYSHFYAFGVSAIDKIAAWSGDIKREDAIIHDEETFNEFIRSGKGALFIGSHLGNLELCRALGEQDGQFKTNAVVFNKNAAKFQKLLEKNDPDAQLNLIHVEEIGVETTILLKQMTDAGEAVVIVGDRTSVDSIGRVHYADFLGEKAPFSEGPYILAGLLNCPVYLIFCFRQEGRYHVHFEHFANSLKFSRDERDELLAKTVQRYADRLAHYCLQAPLQWFNFFDFWRPDTPADIERKKIEYNEMT